MDAIHSSMEITGLLGDSNSNRRFCLLRTRLGGEAGEDEAEAADEDEDEVETEWVGIVVVSELVGGQ